MTVGFDMRDRSVVSSILAFDGDRLRVSSYYIRDNIIRFALVHCLYLWLFHSATQSSRLFYLYLEWMNVVQSDFGPNFVAFGLLLTLPIQAVNPFKPHHSKIVQTLHHHHITSTCCQHFVWPLNSLDKVHGIIFCHAPVRHSGWIRGINGASKNKTIIAAGDIKTFWGFRLEQYQVTEPIPRLSALEYPVGMSSNQSTVDVIYVYYFQGMLFSVWGAWGSSMVSWIPIKARFLFDVSRIIGLNCPSRSTTAPWDLHFQSTF